MIGIFLCCNFLYMDNDEREIIMISRWGASACISCGGAPECNTDTTIHTPVHKGNSLDCWM